MKRLSICVALAALGAAASPGPATVRAGIDNWQRGDFQRSVAIWRDLADKGDADAAFNLGQAYRLGRGVAPDSGAAKTWFEKAARTGHLDAQVSLGLLLFDSGDRAGAMEWLGKAAERGEPRALLLVGTALFNGDVIPRDRIRGYAYVSRAAAQGLPAAKRALLDMDKLTPIAERRKGVALAIAHAKKTTKAAESAAPAKAAPIKPAPLKTPPPRVAAVQPTIAKPVKAPVAPPPVRPAATAGGNWRVQLGAFSARGSAQALFGRLSGKLGGAQAYYIPVGAMTRLQAGPYPTKAAADAACGRLRPQPCFAVAAK